MGFKHKNIFLNIFFHAIKKPALHNPAEADLRVQVVVVVARQEVLVDVLAAGRPEHHAHSSGSRG